MAGWALGLGIVPCFGVTSAVAVGLAITVLVRSRDGRNHGRGLAIAALIVAGLWLLVLLAGAVVGFTDRLSEEAERRDDGSVATGGDLGVLELRDGDCLPKEAIAVFDGRGAEATSLPVMPCDEPHALEVYAVAQLGDADDDYPGDAEVVAESRRACIARLRESSVDRRTARRLAIYFLHPTEQSWAVADDRAVTCVAGLRGETAHQGRPLVPD